MELTRRGVLLGGAAVATLPTIAVGQASPAVLRAGMTDFQLLPQGYGTTALWCYGATVPGAEIRVLQGGRVRRRLVNDLDQPTSTHWHGIRLPNEMDGVAGLTQDAVAPGASFDYDFVAPDAGTFWYHAHNRSFEQVARGLHGALIIEEPEAIDIDRDEVLVFDDWLLDPDTGQIAEGFAAPHDLSHAGRLGNYFTTNGAYDLTLKVKRHERLRLRLINAANARVFDLRLHGLEGWIAAYDGMPLAVPRMADGPIVLGPGQRVDLIADVTLEAGKIGHLVRMDRSDAYSQVAFEVAGGGSTTRRGAPAPLLPNVHAVPDISQATPVMLHMEGGAMGGLRQANVGGRMRSMRDLAAEGHFWAFNGVIGSVSEPPLVELSRGQTAHITIVNDTVFPHAMHLHGMHFHEIEADGSLGAHRDTTILWRGDTREIAFVADNPGNWLLHCHMLSHAASGMTTWIRVR